MLVATIQAQQNEKMLERYAARIEMFLGQYFQKRPAAYPALLDAIRYSLLSGGKRIRSALCYAFSDALQLNNITANILAASLEMIHAFSLIHDDLPGMDDDQLRRGRPTCHVEFDEATAILAGDALNTEAFNTEAFKKLSE